MQQYMSIKEQHQDKFIFFRLGDFYELFFDDAVNGAKLLDLTLTTRDRAAKHPIPMAGVPYHAATNYFKKLLDCGESIVVCEQVGERLVGQPMRREVARVLTPGTIVDDDFIEDGTAPAISALTASPQSRGNTEYGIATSIAIDGIMCVEEVTGPDDAADCISRHHPKELVIPDSLARDPAVITIRKSLPDLPIRWVSSWATDERQATTLVLSSAGASSLRAIDLEDCTTGVVACGTMLSYRSKAGHPPLHIRTVERVRSGDFLECDANTAQQLGLSDRASPAALDATLDVCSTHSGSASLRSWLKTPTLIPRIRDERLQGITGLRHDAALDQIRDVLRGLPDIRRHVTRLSASIHRPTDAGAVRRALNTLSDLAQLATNSSAAPLQRVREVSDALKDLQLTLNTYLVEMPPRELGDDYVIAPGADSQLDQLRTHSEQSRQLMDDLQVDLRSRSGNPNLKVIRHQSHGVIVEAKKQDADRMPDEFRRIQTLKHAERYLHTDTTALDSRLTVAAAAVHEREKLLLEQVIDGICRNATQLDLAGHAATTLDVLAAIAYQARLRNWQNPTYSDRPFVSISDGRHPYLDLTAPPESITGNDCDLGHDYPTASVITGPNMSGKSTYLRTAALLVIMAACGFPVPAAHLRMGAIHRIMCRMGADDALERHQSTFMVEMIETARILRTAHQHSLVIVDEVGRGTGTADGRAIARAVFEDIIRSRALTLFATHDLELAHEVRRDGDAATWFFPVNVSPDDEVCFTHHVREGVSPGSYGVEVARMAGVPERVITRARNLLKLQPDISPSPTEPKLKF